jgi:hypothetical protein
MIFRGRETDELTASFYGLKADILPAFGRFDTNSLRKHKLRNVCTILKGRSREMLQYSDTTVLGFIG